MSAIENIKEWLQQEPDMDNDVVHMNGYWYQPYEIIVRKLWMLCPDGWDTVYFNHQYLLLPPSEDFPNGRTKVSGSIEVWLEYEIDGKLIKRRLSGAATFTTDQYSDNEHWAATVKSLSVVNAVQILGKQFGWGLNGINDGAHPENEGEVKKKAVGKQKRAAVLLPPDEKIKKQFRTVYENKNVAMVNTLLSIYDLSKLKEELDAIKD